MLVVLYTRLQLLSMPLERDEGGYAYIGQRLFSSQRLYTDMLDIKLPGLYFLYWLFDLLPGGQEKSIHLGFLLLHVAALGLFFRWARLAFNVPIAAVATSLFAIAALMPGVYGFAAHATQLIQLPVMGGLLCLWAYCYGEKRQLRQLVLTGLLFGFTFTIKQPAVVFILFGVGVLLLEPGRFMQRIGRAFILGASSLLPFLAIAGYFALQGRFQDFWLWTFIIPTAQTVGANDTMSYLKTLVPMMVGNHWLFWGLGLLSFVLVPFTRFPKPSRFWLLGLGLLSLLSAAIGLGFMPHYFIPTIPWAALGIAVLLDWLALQVKTNQKIVFHALAALLIFGPVLYNADYFLRPNQARIMESCYHWNGFTEIKAISTELKKRLKPGERIAILGSEPQINYYTGTEHCSPQLYMYPLIREHARRAQFQQQFLKNLTDCDAEYLVLTSSEASWMPGFTETPFFKRDLFPRVSANYDLIGRANIGQVPLSIVWDEALKTHQPPQCPPILVFKRKKS